MSESCSDVWSSTSWIVAANFANQNLALMALEDDRRSLARQPTSASRISGGGRHVLSRSVGEILSRLQVKNGPQSPNARNIWL
jgi:hypothetical protein